MSYEDEVKIIALKYIAKCHEQYCWNDLPRNHSQGSARIHTLKMYTLLHATAIYKYNGYLIF